MTMPHFIILYAVKNATTTFTDDQIMRIGLKHVRFAFCKHSGKGLENNSAEVRCLRILLSHCVNRSYQTKNLQALLDFKRRANLIGVHNSIINENCF
jgi:hypothetical protein